MSILLTYTVVRVFSPLHAPTLAIRPPPPPVIMVLYGEIYYLDVSVYVLLVSAYDHGLDTVERPGGMYFPQVTSAYSPRVKRQAKCTTGRDATATEE